MMVFCWSGCPNQKYFIILSCIWGKERGTIRSSFLFILRKGTRNAFLLWQRKGKERRSCLKGTLNTLAICASKLSIHRSLQVQTGSPQNYFSLWASSLAFQDLVLLLLTRLFHYIFFPSSLSNLTCAQIEFHLVRREVFFSVKILFPLPPFWHSKNNTSHYTSLCTFGSICND